jgi:hypothetical protein
MNIFKIQSVERRPVRDSRGGRVRVLECAALVAAGLVAFELATRYPAVPNPGYGSWRETDWIVWYHAQQLYRRDPAELSQAELVDVKEWGRCLQLFDRYAKAGIDTLTDDECQQVVATLEKLCPNLDEHFNLLPFYDACCHRPTDAGRKQVPSGVGLP